MATRLSQINWTVSQSQTESRWTLTIRINYNRRVALERSVIIRTGWGAGGLKPVLRCSNLTLGSAVVHIHIEVARSAWRTSTSFRRTLEGTEKCSYMCNRKLHIWNWECDWHLMGIFQTRRRDWILIMLYTSLKDAASIPTDALIPQIRQVRKHHYLAFQTHLLLLTFTIADSFPQSIRDWNCLSDYLISSAVGAEDSFLFVLRLNVPVNNFSVISGRSHRFLGN